ncbi:MAG: glycerophosphodiester phosphodiesterase [Oscillospiraceae bacterium]|nr:glycerophosphodiester phosphodiesterase [Oscillospiraceae bacterium]
MKKDRRDLLRGLGALSCAGAGLLWLIAPARADDAQRAMLRGRYFAHRGLYDEAAGIPENSLAAFRAAAEAGYGAELDVRMTADGVLVVAHDSDLARMTGAAVRVEDTDFAALEELRLSGTGERVPRFADALDILCGAGVPVIAEIKPCAAARREALCRSVLAELDRRDGLLCVESFDAMIVRWFRRWAPDILRGQLTAQREQLAAGTAGAFLASRVMFDFLGRPQFIAHRVGKKSACVRLAERMGALRVCWTARDYGEEAENDAVIFEHFRPPVSYHE